MGGRLAEAKKNHEGLPKTPRRTTQRRLVFSGSSGGVVVCQQTQRKVVGGARPARAGGREGWGLGSEAGEGVAT